MSEQISAARRPNGNLMREAWVARVRKIAMPVFSHALAGSLVRELSAKAEMAPGSSPFAALEILTRTLNGIAPWIEHVAEKPSEHTEREVLHGLALDALHATLCSSDHPDTPDFKAGNQALVDAAFLAQSFLRAPSQLWGAMNDKARTAVIEGFRATRTITPFENNWWLFAAMIERFFLEIGEPADRDRLGEGLGRFESWYLGDGIWGDGPALHWNYYNSLVIHPFLADILSHEECIRRHPDLAGSFGHRNRRFVQILERLVAPDGSFPAIGRSITYRCGAFHALAQAALTGQLPDDLPEGRARRALDRVICRTLDAPGTFRGEWLTPGLAGHQPALAESYISTASLYLCLSAFLPLGLVASAPFWTDPEKPLTSEELWSGVNQPADHALAG